MRVNASRWLIGTVGFGFAILVISPIGLKSAQAPSEPNGQATDISGLWLVHDPGSGDWSSFFDNVPKPAILPEIQKMNDEENARVAAGNVVSTGGRGANCPTGNLPMMMASSPPLNIVQSKDEVLIGSEASRGRIIYTDGRQHPDAAGLKAINSGDGHSIGHWEGDTLVVDTIGFPARTCDTRWPVMRVPGGGRAKDTTHLTERYKLINSGKQLSVTFTWEDPTIYLKPHTYSYTYDLVENGLPLEGGNDVTDSDLLKQAQGRSRGPNY
ncbi:MAG TPA: hypothetical protein VHE81_06240 [Lacipirellulaceae bacterium]|nr:hypothetical protein [Lacipirellulaceae bacterium]